MPTKRAPGAGRKPDPRGHTTNFKITLRPDTIDTLTARATERGYRSRSALIAAWIENGCKGVRRAR